MLPGLSGFAQSQPGLFWVCGTGVLVDTPDFACALLKLMDGVTNIPVSNTFCSKYIRYLPL